MSAPHFALRKGLDLPILGSPLQEVSDGPSVTKVALRGADHIGLKPTLFVQEGDAVKRGQPLLGDKRFPGVVFGSPGAGRVSAIHRGAKRALQSVVVRLEGDEAEDFGAVDPAQGTRQDLVDHLCRAGAWPFFRTRPFSRVPDPTLTPPAIFVSAMDSNPLAPMPRVAILRKPAEFRNGLHALTRLAPKVFLVTRPGVQLPGQDLGSVQHATFDGPHPAGLVGTHIHFLCPATPENPVWHIGYQDVTALGSLLMTGQYDVQRVIAMGGPAVIRPRLITTRLGAPLGELVSKELADPGRECRVISGSPLHGFSVTEAEREPLGFLGRFHVQVSVLYEGRQREFLGWHMPGGNKFSIKNVFTSALRRGSKKFPMDTNTNGSPRSMVPVGAFEQVMPLDILPTFLLRALLTDDLERAKQLGALELDEEDLSLCTFVCPGKTDYGPMLRSALMTIEKDG